MVLNMVKKSFLFGIVSFSMAGLLYMGSPGPAIADEESSAIFSIISKAKDMANQEDFKGAELAFKTISQQRSDDIGIEYKQKFRERLDELANLFLKKKLYDQAENLYFSRLEVKKEDYGSDDCRYLANMALINLEAGDAAEAEKYNKEALSVSVKQAGPDYVQESKAAKKKSEELWKSGKHKEALEETLSVTEKILKKHESVNYKPYMTKLQKDIRNNWYPPKGEKSSHVKLRFKVLTNGSISHLKVIKSAGDKTGENIYDKAALAAVEKTKPFAPLPKNSPHDVDIEFSLDYNVR